MKFVEDILHEKQQSFISLTETWLKDHLDAELKIDGYTIERADRDYTKRNSKATKGRLSGGVACYVKDELAASTRKLLEFSNGTVECLVLHSKFANLMIITIYRQPDNPDNRSTDRELQQCLNEVTDVIDSADVPQPNVIFLGDFNLPNVNWKTNICSGSRVEKEMFVSLSEFLDNHCLSQYVTVPTHRQGNILDLVFVNNDFMVHSINVAAVLQTTSHHSIVEVSSLVPLSSSSKVSTVSSPAPLNGLRKYNFHSEDIDWTRLNESLSVVDWDAKFNDLTGDEITDKFLSISLNKVEMCNVPLRSSCIKKVRKNLIPSQRRRLMKKRRRAQNRLSSAKLSNGKKMKLKEALVDIEKALMKSYHKQTSYEEGKAFEAIKRNPKFFYSYANKFSKVESKIGPLVCPITGDLVSDNEKMANILADQFSSVFSSPKEEILPADVIFPLDDSLPFTDIDISVQDFLDAIDSIKSNTGAGPFGFSSQFIKKCSSSLAYPLFLLWSKCYDEGVTPAALKSTVVLPAHKGNSRGNGSNYRPITNSSHIIKVFEKVVSKKLVSYLDEHFLFNPNQHGFRRGRSCISELLCHFEEILSILESGGCADVVYLDFSKAFDKVDFQILLKKLKVLGIGGKIGRWIYSFLVNRHHVVCVNGFLSTLRDILSGVPQGSVLGPLLFLILISDIDQNVTSSSLRSFADDSRLTKAIFTQSDIADFQKDLDAVYSWANSNNMVFNETKFEMMRYCLKPTSCSHLETSVVDCSNRVISHKSTVKDLGVIMSTDCLFSEHIDCVLKRMRAKSSWFFRTFSGRSQEGMKIAWKSLILPLHDYSCQLWSPHKIKDIEALEKVQWNFLKRIYGVSSNYWEALKELQIQSLQRRRERYMIFYVWKILENIVPCVHSGNGSDVLQNDFNLRRGRLCTVPAIRRTKSSLQTIRYKSFFVHGAKLFNMLPQSTRNISNCKFKIFKSSVDKFLSTIPDEPHLSGHNFRTGGSLSNCLLDYA